MADSVTVSDPAKRHAATCRDCADLIASFTYIDRGLRHDLAWVPPAGFGQRIAASVPRYEPIERFKLRIPALPAGAVAGLVAAICGAVLDPGSAGLLPITPSVAVVIAVSAGAWLVLDGLSGRALRRDCMIRFLPLLALAVAMAGVCESASGQVPQTAADPPRLTFEVASIRRKAEPVTGGSVRLLPGGRYERISATVSGLLQFAYPSTRGDIVGAPDWVFTDHYDVLASAGRDATLDEIRVMMRSLLEDRLQVRARVVTEEQPIWHLIVARADEKLGPDLKPFTFVCGQPGAPPCGLSANRERVRAVGVPVSRIADFLRVSAGRPIIDRTGLTGNYEFTLVYRPETGRPPDPNDNRPNVFTALEEQLGLTLESARGPVQFILVERIERPTPN